MPDLNFDLRFLRYAIIRPVACSAAAEHVSAPTASTSSKKRPPASSCMEWGEKPDGPSRFTLTTEASLGAICTGVTFRALPGGIGHVVMSGIRSSSNENPALKRAIELCAHRQ